MSPGGLAGWLGAGFASVAILSGATAAVLAAQHREPVLMLDLGRVPPAAPSIAAIAEAAPDVVGEAPATPLPPAPVADEVAPAPAADAPARPETAPPTRMAMAPAAPDKAPPPVAAARPVDPPPEVQAEAKPEKPKREPDAAHTPAPRDKPPEKAAKKAAKRPATAASSPQAGAKAKGGTPKASSAAYARKVLKKVHAVRKKGGAGKGIVVVGFTVAADGGLAGVQILKPSGNTALDQTALGHIRRAAPFPAPPEGVGRSFSFEFVGK